MAVTQRGLNGSPALNLVGTVYRNELVHAPTQDQPMGDQIVQDSEKQ